jgi:hypothetical protein
MTLKGKTYFNDGWDYFISILSRNEV